MLTPLMSSFGMRRLYAGGSHWRGCIVIRARRQHHIGTEHLILGLTKVDDGRAARVFKNLGVSLDDARAEVMRLVTRRATDEPVARRPGAREPAIVIDGKAIAAQVREEAKQRSDKLHERGITPGLALVLVGENPSSLSYVRSKGDAAEQAG